MTTRTVEFDVESLLIGLVVLTVGLTILAYEQGVGAERAAWAAYDEIHRHRSQTEDDPHSAIEADVDGE